MATKLAEATNLLRRSGMREHADLILELLLESRVAAALIQDMATAGFGDARDAKNIVRLANVLTKEQP